VGFERCISGCGVKIVKKMGQGVRGASVHSPRWDSEAGVCVSCWREGGVRIRRMKGSGSGFRLEEARGVHAKEVLPPS
jgi:hypothetical protein